MSRRLKLLPTAAEWVLVLVILTVLGLLIYPGIEWSLRYGPAGADIPSDPPVEANRVLHSSGVSIVAPKNWKMYLDGPGNRSLTLVPRGPLRGRLTASIWIRKLESYEDDPDLVGFKKFQFQSYPAYEWMGTDERPRGASDRIYSTYVLYVDRDGEWWRVRFSIADKISELPPEIRRYIETVQFPPAVEQ